MKIISIGLMMVFAFAAATAQAGVMAFEGKAGEKLFIEAAPKLGKNVHLLKFEGLESPWAEKVIKVTKDPGRGERYSFEYDLELSSGIKKRTYNIVVGNDSSVELNFQGDSTSPVKLAYDKDLTKASQKIDLKSQFEKAPFKPDVE